MNNKTRALMISFFLISISYTLVDDSNNTGATSKLNVRRESSIDDFRYRANSNGDDSQSTIINFFPSRRNVIF